MENNKDIYLTTGRKTRRYEFSLLESHFLRLGRVSDAYGRSVPDLITEGINIVLGAYEHLSSELPPEENQPK